ncbi:hypothetical protein HPP92_028363 [Vanilla planifolia]|uniref:Uncharacterized protein n=1 Tax=Vanilla planifolia TaxID=51239 RepID=A0A835P5P2_VANPL|nr:hypothetical protein HPP92_028363 [Vanilla planifolia]
MAASRPSSRYAAVEPFSSSSSHGPSPVSSLHNTSKRLSSLKNLSSNSSGRRNHADPISVAATRDTSSLALAKNNARTFSNMVKKFMENRSNSKAGTAKRMELAIPADVVSQDLKRTAPKGSGGGFSGLQHKLFGRKELADRTSRKALSEANGNTRTLGMVLRSERELLAQNKEYKDEISKLRLLLLEKNKEVWEFYFNKLQIAICFLTLISWDKVEKLTDLCLRQRDEIKALKDAILFPDAMNHQLKNLFERQSCELEEAKKIIPSLQKQVSSLTGQIQCLADDLAEVKAENYASKNCPNEQFHSPRTPTYNKASLKALGHNYGDPSQIDDDINPCLTPCFSKMKSKGYGGMGKAGSSGRVESFPGCTAFSPDVFSDSCDGMLSRSSERCEKEGAARKTRKSDEVKWCHGTQRLL